MDLDYFRKINRLGNGRTTRDALVEEMVEDYNLAHKNVIHRFDILINTDSAYECYINNSQDITMAVINEKKQYTSSSNREETIQTYPNLIKTGYYFQMKRNETDELNYYLITSEIKKEEGYDEGVFLACNQMFKWKDEYGIHEYPCCATNDSYGVKLTSTSGVLSEREVKLKIQIQDNEDTRRIMPNLRIMFSHSKTDIYETMSIDRTTCKGMIIITCSNDEFDPFGDDLENNLCLNKNNSSEPVEPTTYEINGVDVILHGTNSTFTLSPSNNNCVWSIDQDSIDLELCEIVSQDNTSCVVHTNTVRTTEFFSLYAKDGDTILAEKMIYIKKEL